MPHARSAHLRGMRIGLAGRPLDTRDEGIAIDRDIDELYILSREQEAVAIDEAIVSLARAVFSESGTMVFEDHPLLTPLLEEIALEYWQVPELETDRKELGEIPQPRMLVIGHAKSPQESWSPRVPTLLNYTPEIPEDFNAIVFVANQVQDFQRWRDRRAARKYIIPSTGGMAREAGPVQEFINLDDDLWRLIQGRRSEIRYEDSRERDVRKPFQQEVPEFRYAAYPLLMRRIVEEVIRRG
jgi:hypothetical protein